MPITFALPNPDTGEPEAPSDPLEINAGQATQWLQIVDGTAQADGDG